MLLVILQRWQLKRGEVFFDSCFVNSEGIPAISKTCLIGCRRRETLYEEIYGVQALSGIGDGGCIKGAARAGPQQTSGRRDFVAGSRPSRMDPPPRGKAGKFSTLALTAFRSVIFRFGVSL